MKKSILACAILAAIAPSAFAADISAPVEPAPVAPDIIEAAPASWDGGYIGLMKGYGWDPARFSAGGVTVKPDLDGFLLGGFAGWNYQFDNNFVLGIEGDVFHNWNSKTVAGTKFEADWTGTVRGRIGYAMDNVLLYGAGGWTVTNVSIDPAGPVSRSKNLNGYTLAAGVDYKFTESMFARGEYRFSDFGSANIGGVNADLKQHAVILGVGFKF